jgi:hypothetical protein
MFIFKSSKVALRGLRRLRFFGLGTLAFSCVQLVSDSAIATTGKNRTVGMDAV